MPASVLDALRLDGAYAAALPELAVPWQAQPPTEPSLLALDEPLALELGLDPDALRSEAGLALLTGTALPEGATPVAMAYAGHQFGAYTPLLGDGRALLLGELHDRDGGIRDLHLKGSGRTPFARGGDGLAAVGPMLREHLVSTAMHALGIPTTRSLAVVGTGRHVARDEWLPGAVLARVASSHLRVGTVQLARSTGDVALLRRLVDHAIARHAPDAAAAERPALALLDHVVAVQARLVAQWMLVGFVHGVMNTDNTTLSGETIDYGPCAFMEAYDPATTFSSIDAQGRYRYGNQPGIAQWNLSRLAEALLPLIDDDQGRAIELATASIEAFAPQQRAAWVLGMRAKLGLAGSRVDDEAVAALADDLVRLMTASRADLTGTMRSLGAAARGDAAPLRRHLASTDGWEAWTARWLALEPDAAVADAANPAYVPRNHLVEEALAAATAGDLAPFDRLLAVVRDPFVERPGLERYATRGPDEDFRAYTTYCGT